MKPVYVPEFFTLQELCPKAEYERYGALLWNVFDERLLKTLDQLRRAFGPAICNNWHSGGQFQFRGWRPEGCGVGAPLSQHRFGRAADLSFSEATAALVRGEILAAPELFPCITCLEMDVSWLHFDVRPHDRQVEGMLRVYPR